MKRFQKYLFPPLYGLAVYITIRLVTDSVTGMKFWERSLWLNLGEVIFSMLFGYVVIGMFNWLFKWFDKKWGLQFGYRRILKELGFFIIANLVVRNLVAMPFVALTDDGIQLYDFVIINIIPILFALIYYGIKRSNKFLDQFINSKIQLDKIANDQLQTELKFLKAQYHPHVLFNALNAVYFQIDEDKEEAKKTVEKFSELLRYQLYDQQHLVPIHKEIQYLENFIAIQKIRTSEELQLEVYFDPALNDEQVYPLLFLPLIENAFKYVEGSFIIKIALQKTETGVHLVVENSMSTPIAFSKSGGIGLENLKRRLELLYPNKHKLETRAKEGTFYAELSITFLN